MTRITIQIQEPDYDAYPDFFEDFCLGPRNNPSDFGDDPDPDSIHNHCGGGGGLQSLNDCLFDHDVPLDMKGWICHLVKWQIHPFISKGTMK